MILHNFTELTNDGVINIRSILLLCDISAGSIQVYIFSSLCMSLQISVVLQLLIRGRSLEEFVFSLDGVRPIAGNTVTRALHSALELIGISRDVQKERGIDFHSWRHFYGSMLRGKVSDTDLRSVSGHTTASMTERYSHRLPEQEARTRV